MNKKLVALSDRVIVKLVEDKEDYESSTIIIPDMGKEKPLIAEVVDIGPGRVTEFGTFIKPNVAVGDIVLIPKIGALRIDLGAEEEYFVIADREILCKIEKED